MMASSLRKRELNHSFVPEDMMREILLAIVMLMRTTVRAIGVLPKVSSPSSWRERSTDVLMTAWAFLEVQRA